jgi:hypothetical protein
MGGRQFYGHHGHVENLPQARQNASLFGQADRAAAFAKASRKRPAGAGASAPWRLNLEAPIPRRKNPGATGENVLPTHGGRAY